MNRKLSTVVIAVLLIGVVIAYAKKRQSFEHSEPLGDVTQVELQIDLKFAETIIKAGTSETLVEFSGEYDEYADEPTLEVERRTGGKAFVHLDSEKSNIHFGNNKDIDGGEYLVTVSPTPEYSIRCEVGLGNNFLDLTDLKIKRLVVESGLAETNIVLDKPNELEADRVDIETGLGELDTDHLGYLRFKRLTVDAGMGEVTLDLRGYEGEGTVDISVGMGSCNIFVPHGLGVRVHHDGGFMSSIDLDDMVKVRKGVWESEDFDDAENTLVFDLSVGMGDVDLRWK
ncbi:MAG TPA: hypothetical protein ENH10_05160 [Bacteroidetes bacterium]|nr:hypothetical protein [Bacteroidota bacterium]HEX04531.1 hypothetical protein [Bacteroidota bacterium]